MYALKGERGSREKVFQRGFPSYVTIAGSKKKKTEEWGKAERNVN